MESLTGNYPAPIGPNTGNQYGRLYSDDGTSWYDLANNDMDNSFNLRGYIEENNSVLGTMVFKNEVCLTPKPIHGNAFIDSTQSSIIGSLKKLHNYFVIFQIFLDFLVDSYYNSHNH